MRLVGAKYQLTFKTFEVGAAVVKTTDVTQVLRQYMQQAFAECNETMHCGVRVDRDVLYIDKIESTQSIRMSSYVGAHAPLHCTSLGKAILSTYSDEEIRALYQTETLPAITQHTITSVAELLFQMQDIRRMGYAVEREENNENVCCVAVPLRNGNGRAVYALSISAPLFRMGEKELAHCAQLLVEAQQRIERFLKDA